MRWVSLLVLVLVAYLTSGCFMGVGAAIGAAIPRYEEDESAQSSSNSHVLLKDGDVTVQHRGDKVIVLGPASGTWTTEALSTARHVGTPIAMRDPIGDGVLIAWLERESTADPWRVRVVRWLPGREALVLEQHETVVRGDPPALAWTGRAIGDSVQIVDPAIAPQTTEPVRKKVGSYWLTGFGIGAVVDVVAVAVTYVAFATAFQHQSSWGSFSGGW